MKRTFIVLGRLWKVQTINYCKDVTNITLGVVLTLMTMVCWVAFKAKDSQSGLVADPFVLASAMGISAIRNSQYNFNLTLTDWRLKGLFKNLAATPLPKSVLFIAILLFNWVINILVAMLLFGVAMIFADQRAMIQYVNWPIFVLGFVLNVLLSNVMAIALTFLWKKRDLVLVVSLLSYFGPMYLLGLGIPWNVSGNIQWLNDFLYLWPHRYTLAIMQSGWIWEHVPNFHFPDSGDILMPGGINEITSPFLYSRQMGMGGQLWIPVVASCGWILLFGLFIWWAIKREFVFGRRGIKGFAGIDKHLNYISQIKKAQSLGELDAVINNINEENMKMRAKRIELIKHKDSVSQHIPSKDNKSNKGGEI